VSRRSLGIRVARRAAQAARHWLLRSDLWASRTLQRRLKAAIAEGVVPAGTRPHAHPQAFLLGRGDGEWAVHATALSAGAVAHSYGVGQDVSFDLDLIRRHGVDVHAFDPTPIAAEWIRTQNLPARFRFHDYGIADFDGTMQFELPASHGVSFVAADGVVKQGGPVSAHAAGEVKRFDSIVQSLGHRRIAVLKLDIEGQEYSVLPEILSHPARVDQLLVEFHHRWDPAQGALRTRAAIRSILAAGYELFYISPREIEFGFVKTGQAPAPAPGSSAPADRAPA
jgi:FkbM family methyltransferase